MSTFTSYPESGQAQASSSTSTSNIPTINSAAPGGTPTDDGKKKKAAKRRKVNHACLYCRRSHMTCDEGRPCQRWCVLLWFGPFHIFLKSRICPASSAKSGICATTSGGQKVRKSHQVLALEILPKVTLLVRHHAHVAMGVVFNRAMYTVTVYQPPPPPQQPTNSAWPLSVPQGQFLYQPETLGNEFSVLRYVSSLLDFIASRTMLIYMSHIYSDFLETLDEGSFFTSPQNNTLAASLLATAPYTPTPNPALLSSPFVQAPALDNDSNSNAHESESEPAPAPVVLPAATKTEQFLLTAADQESGSRNERLNRVIRSKYEAGLLKPYNYVKGYARLSRWMDRKYVVLLFSYIKQTLSSETFMSVFRKSRNSRYCNLCRSCAQNLGYDPRFSDLASSLSIYRVPGCRAVIA